MSINYPILVNFSHYRHLRGIWIHSIITYFQTHSILTNKANFGNDKMNITIDMTSDYMILSTGSGQKTNPIQTQFKPIQSQFKPNRLPGKPLNLRIIWIDFQSGKRYNKGFKSNIWGAKTTEKYSVPDEILLIDEENDYGETIF